MDVSEFLEGIGCTEYRDVFDSFDADEEKRLFFSDFSRFVENGRKKADPEFYFLSIFLHLGFDCHEIYKERSIPDSIYFATFHDISIWARWYHNHTGKVGVDRINWLRNHVNMRLFRLGELELELPSFPLDEIWEKSPCDNPFIFVHVPEGASLNKAEESFSYALEFFSYDKATFLMHSWLLSPEIYSIADDSSRIKAFSSLFTLIGREYDRQAEERIFGFVSDDMNSYPVTSSLSRKVKSALLRGENISSGYGYLERFSR